MVCSSSDGLRESVLQAAGLHIKRLYEEKDASAAAEDTFALECPHLPCKEIFFQEWKPFDHSVLTEQNLKDFMTTAIDYVLSRNYKSVAFPSIGCGQFSLDPEAIAQIMINHVKTENYPINVAFIIHPQSHAVFQAFRNANTKKKYVSCTF